MKKKNKKITLGISGGIAAYKSCEIARLLVKRDIDVQVMMTGSAQKFVTSMTFQALTGKPVATNLFSLTEESQIGHIQIADTSDLILIAPATANIMAKVAHGLCDDIVTTVILATKSPVVFAASMNVNMYNNAFTQENMKKLKSGGYHMIEPEEGDLACGWEGKGRMAEPETIVKTILKLI